MYRDKQRHGGWSETETLHRYRQQWETRDGGIQVRVLRGGGEEGGGEGGRGHALPKYLLENQTNCMTVCMHMKLLGTSMVVLSVLMCVHLVGEHCRLPQELLYHSWSITPSQVFHWGPWETQVCVCISVCGEGGERKARGANSVIKHAPDLTVRPQPHQSH